MAEPNKTAPDFYPLSKSGAWKSKKNGHQKKSARFTDHKLYNRLLELLNSHTVVDVDSIIIHLQKYYPEYRRKKRQALKNSVEAFIEKIQKDLNIPDDSNENSLDNPIGNPITNFNNNHVNDLINNLYNNDDNNPKRKFQDNSKGPLTPNTNKKSRVELNSSRIIDKDIENSIVKKVTLNQKYLITPKISFNDFGGVDNVIEDMKRLVFHLRNSELYRKLGIEPPRGFLLHGPPGVGKSLLVEALANDLQISYLRCGATEIVAGISGESEEKIRQLFLLAKELRPCLLFIDEIDAITPKRENASREMERRIVTQLITCIDELSASDGSGDGVMIIGATNRPEALDPALRRAGRFDKEIALGIPDEKSRQEILKVLFSKIKAHKDFDLKNLAHKTPGYVGADLKSLIREAAILSLERHLSSNQIEIIDYDQNELEFPIENFHIEMEDFDRALKKIQPSSKREGFATVPDVTWNDIGALSSIRQELQISILAPVRFSNDVQKLGLSLSVGILLCGPPGCGKTLLAKAIANESGINFISVKGPELLNMYVGESERAVRAVFNRARISKPCVIFFDEIDALCPRRTDSSDSSNVTSRVVNQLLTEMDGLESRDCFLLAATNRPDILDPAILRPGRFDKILHVGFPSAQDRFEILWTITKQGTRPPISLDVDLKKLAHDQRLDGFSGADLSSLIRETSLIALRQKIDGQLPSESEIILNKTHFDLSLEKVKPSISEHERKRYMDLEKVSRS